jgi:cbb3-type cytochrome oxidase cytochrome c subunit
MKRWLVRVAVAVSVLLGTAAPIPPSLAAQSPAPSQKQDPKSITVYVTRTGEKYHRDGCRYLRQSRIPMSLAEAAKRYGPCSVCKPPTLR